MKVPEEFTSSNCILLEEQRNCNCRQSVVKINSSLPENCNCNPLNISNAKIALQRMVNSTFLSELSEFLAPRRVLGRELSELLPAYYLCAKASSPILSRNSLSLSQNPVGLSSLKQYSRNSIPPVSWLSLSLAFYNAPSLQTLLSTKNFIKF